MAQSRPESTSSASRVDVSGERGTGPAIDGVTTLGTRAQLQSGGGSETRTLYTFVAVLSPQTSVMIQGSENPDQLKAMLVKSVAAIRG